MKKAIEYIIRAKDATGAGIKSAMGRIKSFAANIGRNLANIQSGLSMAMGAVQKFASVVVKSIGEAFKFEKATSDFKVLLGSIDAAKEHMADLRSFAASTPLTFEDLAKSSKLLLSFGASVDEVMPAMKMLGDIAMGDAQKFQGLSLVFAQVKSAGKLMGQDLLQMINQGFNPLTIIAKQTGKSMSELKDMMGEGLISFEMVSEAMRIATSEGGLFNNAMGEAAKTGEGLVSTLQDNWMEAVRTFGEALMDVSKGGIQWCINKIQELKESGKIQEWAEKAKKAIYTVIGAFNGLSEASTRTATWTAIKDVVVGGFEEAAKAAVGILVKGFHAICDMMGKISLNPFSKNSQWRKEVEVAKELGIKGVGQWSFDHEVEGIDKVRAEIRKREQKEVEKIFGGTGSRFQRGINALKKIGIKTLETAGEIDSTTKVPLSTGENKAKKVKPLSELMAEAEAEEKAKAEAEAAKKAKAAEEAARKAAEAEEKERLRIEKAIAAERERLRKAEMKAYERELTKAHQAAQEKDAAAQDRLSAAQEKSRQAWGWYRDKDSLVAQLEEERAEAAAQKQFEKDFEKLRFRRDWRTAAAYGSGKMGALSLDEEAVRRVALAREEEAAAKEYARETAEACSRSAEALEHIQKRIEEEG